jgi:fatty acid desaturase
MSKSIKGIIKPSELTPFLSHRDGLNAFVIIFIYSLAFGLVALAHHYAYLPLTIFCMILMGGLWNTVATFIHETAHGHVFSHKNINDRLGHFFFAAPLMSYLEDYRYLHWEHHRHTGKLGRDPELNLYRALGLKPSGFTKKEVLWVFIQSIVGISALRGLIFLNKFYMAKRKEGLTPKPGVFEHASVGFWYVIVPLIMWKLGMLASFLLVWLVPMFTVCITFLLWHGFGEHIREKESCLCENTFTHNFDPITKLFIYPIQSGYHLEHHLFPQLPWYNMSKFRKWAELRPDYKLLAKELEADSYFYGKKSIVSMSFSE